MQVLNNKRLKNGITLIVLVITIIVTLILVSTITISYNSIRISTLKKEFAKEIFSVQKLVEQYKFKNNKYPIKEAKTVNITNIDENSKTQFADEPGFDSGSITLNEIDLYETGVESLNRGVKKDGNEKDIYVVSTNTSKVFYLKGEAIDGIVYYTLTDELKKQIGLN